MGFKLNAIDINTFLSSIERKLQGIPNVSNNFFEVPGGSMAPPERVADHLSLVIEQARLKPEAKRQKVDDTNLESSKTTEHALVVLTSPVYQEKLSKTAKALAAPGGGITVATDLFARYSPGNTDGFDAQLLRVARSSGTLGSSVNTDAQLLPGVRKGTTDAMVAVASSDDTYKVDVSTLACNSVTASGTKQNLVEVIRTGRYDELSPVAVLVYCAEAYPEWARLGKSDLTRALADKKSPLGPEGCARTIIFALKAVADPAFQQISPWEKVAFSGTVGSFMDLRSRGASEREVQQFFKDHLKSCTIVFREWLQGARGEPPLFSDVDPRLAQRIEDCANEASLAERMRARETLSVTTKPQQSQRHQESAWTSPKGSKKRKGAAPNSKPKKGSSGGSASPRKQSRSEPEKL